MGKELLVIIHNIRSAYNVGSIFRTADGIGATKIYLTGYAPIPHKKGKILQTAAEKMIAKTALGAEQQLPWEQRKNVVTLINQLKKKGYTVVALEQSAKSIHYLEYRPKFPMALILGNEPRGLDRRVLDKCDAIMEIPMFGSKNSLNVAVAFGVAGYQLVRGCNPVAE